MAKLGKENGSIAAYVKPTNTIGFESMIKLDCPSLPEMGGSTERKDVTLEMEID